MINPFRNAPPGLRQLMSTAAYSPIPRSRTSSIRHKGFFYRLANWGGLFHRSPDSMTIEIEAREPAPDQNRSAAVEPCLWSERSDQTRLDQDEMFDQRVRQYLHTGHMLMQQGDIAAAITQYRQVIQLVPNHGEAYQYLAEALTQQGELAEAAYCYRQAIEFSTATVDVNSTVDSIDSNHRSINSEASGMGSEASIVPAQDLEDRSKQTGMAEIPWFEQASFYLQQAIVNCNAGDWQDARVACEQAIERLEPEAFTAYLILGRTLQGQGQLSEAEQAYHKALTLRPHMAETYARLGSLYAAQQRLSDAVKQYQTAIQLDSTFAGAYWKLAEVWQQLDAEVEATSCWYQAFRLQPNWASATEYCQLGDRLLKLGKLEAAQDCYERAIQGNSNLIAAYLGLGTVLSQRGQSQAAIDCYQQVIKLNPQSAQIYLSAGNGLAQLDQWKDAIICLQRMLQIAPDHLEALAGLRQGYVRLEQWQEAWIYSSKLAELQSNSAQNWHQLGDVLSKLHRWSEAVDAYQKAIVLEPNFSWSHNNLGDALLQLEEWQQAASAFRAAIALNPNFAWSHYNLGQVSARTGDWDEAINAYRCALQLQSDLPFAAGHLADALQQRAVIDQESALAFYQQAIRQNPYDPEHYHKLLELQPDNIDSYLGLVEALLVQNRLDEAFVFCQLARQLRPDDTEIIAKLKHILQQRELAKQPQIMSDEDYDRWLQQHTPTNADLKQMAEAAAKLPYQPLISILMPVYNPPESFLRAAIESVLHQVYQGWQLCIADDASSELDILAILEEYAARDPRIKVVFREENGHISTASNSALALAEGEFIALLDHDDVLAPEALYEVVSLLNQHPNADMIYSDEDKLNQQGQRNHPFFKPDWCPDSFLSRMYTCHLGIYRRCLVEKIGGFRVGYEGSQDYDLVLRLTEQTDRIFHIPKVLYHWRSHAASTASHQNNKSYAEEAAKRAIAEACQRRGETIKTIETDSECPGVYRVRYQITEYKPVSIIIPTRNLGIMLDRCLQSLFDHSTYPNYEVIVIDNGSNEIETLRVLAKWQQQQSNFRTYSLDIPFNYSQINNFAVTKAKGDYLLFLNNDVEITTPGWIEAMVEQAQRSTIGAVGALLLYPDHTIQHAGVVLGIGGIAGHSHKYFPADYHGYFSQAASINNYSAVTAACLMCRREVFEKVRGFDETLAVAFNDVDLCLKIRHLGYRNIYLPHVVLYHHESKSRGTEDTREKQIRFKQEFDTIRQRWGELLQQDPCYSPNLTLDREDYGLRF